MTTITGSDTFFTNIDATFTATKWEACIDQAVDKINGYLREDILPNMSGTAGSKSLVVTSGQAGFIRSITVAIYANTKNAGASASSYSIGALSESSSSSSSASGSSNIDEMAKEAASVLQEIQVYKG